MGFFDYILNNFIRRRKKLPEGKFQEDKKPKEPMYYDEALKFSKELSVGYTPKVDTLDFAIEQYLSGLLFQHQQGEPYSSYKALTMLCSLNNEYGGKNAKRETALIKELADKRDVVIINQPSELGGTCYRHIAHGEMTGKEEYRLYLSCKRADIAELASKFMEEFGDKAYYFKFCSDEHAAKTRRTEQFVFYIENNEEKLNEILQVIERTKQKNPKLFESSRNLNPFMKNLSGYIGYAPEVEGIYKNLRGEKVPVSKSFNSLLSMALEDSFLHAVTEVVSRDFELSEMVNGEKLPRARDYVKTVLSEIVHERPDAMKNLVSNMKQNLITLSKINPELQINGIELSKGKKQTKDQQIEYDD